MMDETFLDLPLDRDLYRLRELIGPRKKPIRVLITEAGSKTAYNLMYKICSGQVFGPDQDVILHLINTKGSIDVNISVAELYGCGFDVFLDAVVSSEPEKTYKKVDVVVLLAAFEEISGHPNHSAFIYQLVKCRQVAKNTLRYGKPRTKLIIASPSTKGIMILLTALRGLEPDFKIQHLSGVVILDETITKSLLAAKLRTTTDKIKNVTIWGATHPDVREATVLMFHPEDKGNFEEEEIPITEALPDQKWLTKDLTSAIFERVVESSFVRSGLALASATATHLRHLIRGTDSKGEIVSMATVIPPSFPYGLDKNVGFSFPVTTKEGVLTIRDDVKFSTGTHLLNLKVNHILHHDSSMQSVYRLINYIHKFEACMKKDFAWSDQPYGIESQYSKGWMLKYIISPIIEERSNSFTPKDTRHKKSITWDDVRAMKGLDPTKSNLHFDIREKVNVNWPEHCNK